MVPSSTNKYSLLRKLLSLIFFLTALQIVVAFPYGNKMNMETATLGSTAIMFVKLFVRSLLFSCFVSLPLVWIKQNLVSRIYIWIAGILASVFYFFESYLFISHGSLYGYGVLQAMGGTNAQETKEYLSTMNWQNLSYSILLFVVIILLTLLLARLSKYLHLPQRVSGYRNPLRWAYSLFICLSVLALQKNALYLVQTFSQINALASTPWERFAWNTYAFRRDTRLQEEGAKRIEQIDLSSVGPHQLPPHNLVIIIGESLRRDYMHSYGYYLENTPHQDSLIARGDLVIFPNTVSPTPGTVGSVTRMMTFLRNETGRSNWYEYPALTEVLERAGYQTSWVSNQETMGEYIRPLSTLMGLADEQTVTNSHSAAEGYRNLYPDEDVLPYLKTQEGDKSFCQIIHLLGSHQDYALRYPKAYERFTAKDLTQTTKGQEKDEMVARYLNTVYYNDYVISEIVKRYSDTPSLVVYFSDHGQALYDNPDNPDLCTHGLYPEAVRVPLQFYVSPALQKAVPSLMARIKEASSRPVMLDVLPNSLCGLLGIQHKLDEEKYDFFSPKFDSDRPRWVLGLEGGAKLLMP